MDTDTQADQDLLREAARALVEEPGAFSGCDDTDRYANAARLRQWAIELECGVLDPAERATAVLLAKRIMADGEVTPER